MAIYLSKGLYYDMFLPAECSYHSFLGIQQIGWRHQVWGWPRQWEDWALREINNILIFKSLNSYHPWIYETWKWRHQPLESNFLNFWVAMSCWSGSSENIIWIMSWVITPSCTDWHNNVHTRCAFCIKKKYKCTKCANKYANKGLYVTKAFHFK